MASLTGPVSGCLEKGGSASLQEQSRRDPAGAGLFWGSRCPAGGAGGGGRAEPWRGQPRSVPGPTPQCPRDSPGELLGQPRSVPGSQAPVRNRTPNSPCHFLSFEEYPAFPTGHARIAGSRAVPCAPRGSAVARGARFAVGIPGALGLAAFLTAWKAAGNTVTYSVLVKSGV